MADTYTQLYIHFVFVVKNRASLIHPSWEGNLYKYITGIIQNKSHKMIAIDGMPDHLHIFIGFKPSKGAMKELVKVVKGESTKWINEKGYAQGKFRWQTGYGAFSYSHSHIDRVYHYIHNQKKHHRKKSFKDDYLELLNNFDVDYDEKYIFKPIG